MVGHQIVILVGVGSNPTKHPQKTIIMKSHIDYITTHCNYQYLGGDNNCLLFKKPIDHLEIHLQIDASLFQMSMWIEFNDSKHKITTNFSYIDEIVINNFEHELLDKLFGISLEELEE